MTKGLTFWESIRLLLQHVFCRDELKELAEAEEQRDAAQAENVQVHEALAQQGLQIADLNVLVKKLKEKRGIEIPESIKAKAAEIRAKYPAAFICYKGFKIELKSGTITPEIRLQDFVHVLPSHRNFCETRGLTLANYVENNPDIEFGELVNELAWDIYLAWLDSKKYKTDADLYGVEEQWSSLLATWYVREMDCENSTLEYQALIEAAGLVGDLRAFFWNVCGSTYSGFGHSTLNAYDFRDDCFRHVETTLTVTNKKSFHDLPRWDSSADLLNIRDVWFSFNSEMARHTFKTDSAAETFKNRGRFRNVVIKGMR